MRTGKFAPARSAVGAALTAADDPMVRNSLAIMTSTVMTSLLGYLFWIIVTRTFSPEVSGTAAATTSAIQATVLVASIGAAAAMVEWLPRCSSPLEWRQRVTAGLLVSAVSAAVGAGFVVGVFGFWHSTLPQLASPHGAVLFVAACVFFAVGLVLDYIAVSEHRGGLLLVRSMVLCGLRIPLLLIPISALTSADSILLAWTLAAGASLVWVVAAFGSRSGRSLLPSFDELRPNLRQMASSLIGQHLITVAAMLAGYLLPVIVYVRLSAADNSYFYITWMLGSVFSIISPAVAGALFVEGAAKPSELPQLARRCLLTVSVLLVVPMLVYIFGGGLILSLFGEGYVEHGQLLLVLLAIAAIPDSLTNIAVAVLRITNRMRAALTLNAGMLVACLVGSWIALPTTGIAGVGILWLATQSIGALWVIARWRWILGAAGPIVSTDFPLEVVDVPPGSAVGARR